jgi:hypothetical protein
VHEHAAWISAFVNDYAMVIVIITSEAPLHIGYRKINTGIMMNDSPVSDCIKYSPSAEPVSCKLMSE